MSTAAREVIKIPYAPRPLQRELHQQSKRFSVYNLHRRFGKTVFAVNALIHEITQETLPRPRGSYIAPYRSQAKTIAWEYLKHYTLPIPGMRYNESELRADFPNGARISLYGADNPHSLRGIYQDFVVLDEVAQMSPILWTQVIRPALADRKGGAIFIGTPQGMSNLFYRLYEQAGEEEDWNRRIINIEESGYITPEEIEVIKREMPQEEFEQEFMCSWSAAIRGAYYSREMQEMEEEGRITTVPYDPAHPVITSWDLGVKDATVVWYWQVVGSQIRAIRCEAFQGMKLADMIKQVGSHKYHFGQHIAPHDIKVRELGEGSRHRQARNHGVNFTVAPEPAKISLKSGINEVKNKLTRMIIDRDNCRDGIDALKTYRSEYNEKRNVFSNTPLHDWASDYADSVRYFAITKLKTPEAQEQGQLDYSLMDTGVF